MLPQFTFCLNKFTRVIPFCAFYQRSHYARAQSFSIADNGILSLLAEVAYEEYAKIDASQLFEQSIHRVEQLLATLGISDDSVYHFVMPVNDGVKFITITLIACNGEL